MRGGEEIRGRIFDVAVRNVRLADHLAPKPGGWRILANQYLRAATFVGANLEEAQAADSRADFAHKLAIAPREGREAHWWLRALTDSSLVEKRRVGPITREADGIVKAWSAILSSTRGKRRKPGPSNTQS